MTHSRDVAEPHEVHSLELDAFVIVLEGEFDIAERARLLDAFAVTASAPIVIVSFEKTRYVDSTVLECLVALERSIGERSAKLLLVDLRPEIRRIFEVCGLQRHFDIRERLGDVIAALELDSARMRRLTLVAEPVVAAEAIEVNTSPHESQ